MEVSRLARIFSPIFMGAFAGGCLVVSVVMVPSWRSMDPESFSGWFRANGPKLGATMFPMDAAGALLAVSVSADAVRRGSRGRPQWVLSAVCIVSTLGLLPAYFGRANARMMDETTEAAEVTAELERWQRWQWLRTALTVLATALAGWGMARR